MKNYNTAVLVFSFSKLDLTQLPNEVYVATAPTSIVITVTKPNATTSNPSATLVPGTVATYSAEVYCDQVGVWKAAIVASGAVVAQEPRLQWDVT